MASYLVTDNDSSSAIATTALRPEWTKAKTRSSKLEPSLADLEQKTLFLPRSALSESLKEIGHGQFGKISIGVYKRSEEEGLPVAINTMNRRRRETSSLNCNEHNESLLVA